MVTAAISVVVVFVYCENGKELFPFLGYLALPECHIKLFWTQMINVLYLYFLFIALGNEKQAENCVTEVSLLMKVSGVIFVDTDMWGCEFYFFYIVKLVCWSWSMLKYGTVLWLQVTRLCDLSSETDSVTSVSWNERVCREIFCPIFLSSVFKRVH